MIRVAACSGRRWRGALLRRIAQQRLKQGQVAREAGISRAYLQLLITGEKNCSLFVFLELSRGLRIEPGELLRDVLNRRDLLRER
jgi:DNA-binding Xre family transcriptional regulator